MSLALHYREFHGAQQGEQEPGAKSIPVLKIGQKGALFSRN